MLRKVAALFIAWYAIAIVLSGCCNCPPPPTYNFRWTRLAATTHAYTISGVTVTNSEDTSLDFSGNSLLIKVHLDYELITAAASPGFSMIDQAYACSCVDGFYHPEHALSSLKVISVHPFDSDHSAMSDVTEYFKSKKYTGNGQPDGLRDLNPHLQESSIYEMQANEYDLYLDKRPTINGDHQFNIVFTLNDSSTIAGTTPVVHF